MKTIIEIPDKVISDEIAALRKQNNYIEKKFRETEKELDTLRRLKSKYNSYIEKNKKYERELKDRDLELDVKEERINALQKKTKEEMKRLSKSLKITMEDMENHWVFFDEHSSGEL